MTVLLIGFFLGAASVCAIYWFRKVRQEWQAVAAAWKLVDEQEVRVGVAMDRLQKTLEGTG